MANKYTPLWNYINILSVQEQILRKRNHIPHLATISDSEKVITDYDTFPYPRYFRGIPQSSVPIVAEREAGWRPRNDYYRNNQKIMLNDNYPAHFFEAPCSTVFPLTSKNTHRLSTIEKLLDNANNSCVVQYR